MSASNKEIVNRYLFESFELSVVDDAHSKYHVMTENTVRRNKGIYLESMTTLTKSSWLHNILCLVICNLSPKRQAASFVVCCDHMTLFCECKHVSDKHDQIDHVEGCHSYIAITSADILKQQFQKNQNLLDPFCILK